MLFDLNWVSYHTLWSIDLRFDYFCRKIPIKSFYHTNISLTFSSLIQAVSRTEVSTFLIDKNSIQSHCQQLIYSYINCCFMNFCMLFFSWNRIRILKIAFKTPMTQIKRVYSLTQTPRKYEFHSKIFTVSCRNWHPLNTFRSQLYSDRSAKLVQWAWCHHYWNSIFQLEYLF